MNSDGESADELQADPAAERQQLADARARAARLLETLVGQEAELAASAAYPAGLAAARHATAAAREVLARVDESLTSHAAD